MPALAAAGKGKLWLDFFRNSTTEAGARVRRVHSTRTIFRERHSMRKLFVVAALTLAALQFAPAVLARTPSPENAQVYFIWPSDGTVIHGGKFWVRMGLRNMGVA